MTTPRLVSETATRRLTVRLERSFTPAMEQLRRSGWNACPAGAARDEFDDDSVYVVVSTADGLVGMVRVTRADPSVLGMWSNGQAPLPRGRDVAELTRGVVVASMRRLGIYRLAMLETLLRLPALGIRFATAAIEPDLPARRFLTELGFRPEGEPIVFDDYPRSRTLAQPIVLAVEAHDVAVWEALRERQVDRLLDAGYVVQLESGPAVPSMLGQAALV